MRTVHRTCAACREIAIDTGKSEHGVDHMWQRQGAAVQELGEMFRLR